MNNIDIALGTDGPAVNQVDRIPRSQFLRLGKWFTLALCLLAALLPLPFGRPGVWSLLGLSGLVTWRTALSGMLGTIVAAAIVWLAAHWRPLQVLVKRLVRLIAWETFQVSDYIFIAAMAALGEELLFRGAMQPLIGLVPTALVFGLLHATSIAHVVLAGLLGLLLGWLLQWTGSLWPPIVAHLSIDLVTGLLLARTVRRGMLFARGD